MKKNLLKKKKKKREMQVVTRAALMREVTVRDSGVLQVCHFGAISWHEPKPLTSCLWWSSQLPSFPGARRLLDPVQCVSVMKMEINSTCSLRVCVCNQCN